MTPEQARQGYHQMTPDYLLKLAPGDCSPFRAQQRPNVCSLSSIGRRTVYFEIKQDLYVQNCLADQRENGRQRHHQLHSNTAQRDESEALRWFTQAKQDVAAAIANQQDSRQQSSAEEVAVLHKGLPLLSLL